ncbi:MAG: YciI family protein [Acidobacteriia bacterium]|nr:YciI family protein [Terriglobia bacterium]
MPYYVLFYDVVDDYVTRRAPFRQEHLKLAADAHARGEIVMGGAFADPANKVLIVFRGEDRSVAESFARKDPYVINGLVTRWEVRPWTVVIGGADTVPPAAPKP